MSRATWRRTILAFIVLGGVAYSAGLSANSVGTKQLKNGSLTGRQINASTLGTVPSATHAVSAGPTPASSRRGGTSVEAAALGTIRQRPLGLHDASTVGKGGLRRRTPEVVLASGPAARSIPARRSTEEHSR
jgi:hypothetical protein